MTDHDPRSHPLDREPLHPLDELASAHVDGVADPIDVAAASGLPGFAERVAGFERVRTELRAAGPVVDDARRETALAAALAAFDASPVLADEPAPTVVAATATVTPIEVAAARRGRPGRRWQLVGAAAAVAAGALALVPLLTRDQDDEPSSEVAADAFDTDAFADDGSAGRSAMEESTPLASPSSASKIGDFRDYDELAGAVKQRLDTPLAVTDDAAPASPTTVTSAPSTTVALPPNSGGDAGGGSNTKMASAACPPSGNGTTASDSGTAVISNGEATVDGEPYTVDVTEDETGNRTMIVRDPDSCDVVEEREL
jgi:hypothetical protein